MDAYETQLPNTPFRSERACVSYLFQKRWPTGFKCPFCDALQREMAPAYVAVCRYCRKQTSITAHTLMHGSKMSLAAWMEVAWQFCLHKKGLSARELQRFMKLSCYQTAWIWLQKIRLAAALAESNPCCGIVLFELTTLPVATSSEKALPHIGMALEMSSPQSLVARVRLKTLHSRSANAITTAINELLEKNSTLLTKKSEWLSGSCQLIPFLAGQPTKEQLERGRKLLLDIESWLNSLFRGAITPSHLQGYLDEFCFRNNTASWDDYFVIFDHLVSGLLCIPQSTVHRNRTGATGERP